MSIFKCKMCGGELQITPGESVAVCDYCGTTQTLPRLDDDHRTNLYDRANHFRRNNDFDKAAGIYEQILNEDKTDAEAYWSLVLCRYGIEYVEDPATHKRVPTVNRAQYTSVFDDEDYKAAIQYADSAQRAVYEAEAMAINEIQKGILEISQKEEPFDVFICYKETDANGRRTPDSVLATDLYHQLTQEGFKVFFSRITLEDKLGAAYEPYIFAALNSAKVMVVLGTKPEYFNAVWVKNEWSRYLALIRGGAKKVLIPAYRDMDPYDLPEEFSHLQAQDMSKLGFMQDLIRGIKKLTATDKPAVKETVVVQESAANTAPLLKRAFMFLEDGDWSSADEYCEKVLDLDPECAQAYLGKLMADLRVRKQEQLADCDEPFDDRDNFRKVIRFGDETLCTTLAGYIAHIKQRNEEARLNELYTAARQHMDAARSETDYKQAAEQFAEISNYRDADKLRRQCLEKAEECRKDAIYNGAAATAAQESPDTLREAAKCLTEIPGWRDADQLRSNYLKRADELEAEARIAAKKRAEEERLAAEKRAEEEHLAAERKAEDERKAAEIQKKRKKIIAIIGAAAAVILIAVFLLVTKVIQPSNAYKQAEAYLADGKVARAAICFAQLGNYKDAETRSIELWDEIRSIDDIISICSVHAVGLRADGTVAAVGNNEYGQCDVDKWNDIVAVSTGELHTVGLRSDGTVVAAGDNSKGQCNVSEWRDIVNIYAGTWHTFGICADGTVVTTGDTQQCAVKDWTDIIDISAGTLHTVGLRADGTVVAVGGNEFGQCDVGGWTNIVAIATGDTNTFGLRSDGTLVTAGENYKGQTEVDHWSDIAAISAGFSHVVGMKEDGAFVTAGSNEQGQLDISDWDDIVAISAGGFCSFGLHWDGTVTAAGINGHGQCDVSDWADIVIPAQVR